MSDIKERLDSLKSVIQTPEFIAGIGLGNEENIRIFEYEPEDEMVVRYFIEQLTKDSSLACNLVECNLYHILLEICEAMDVMDAIPEMEETEGSAFLLEQLQILVSNEDLMDRIRSRIHDKGYDESNCVILITGIGEAYPYIRLNRVLEVLQPYLSGVPRIAMYPGVFDGSSIKLFNRLKASGYYRGFSKF